MSAALEALEQRLCLAAKRSSVSRRGERAGLATARYAHPARRMAFPQRRAIDRRPSGANPFAAGLGAALSDALAPGNQLDPSPADLALVSSAHVD